MSKKQHPGSTFGQQYISLREKEQRIYTPGQVAQLPEISKDHVHYQEWLVRRHSCDRLLTYLAEQQRPLDILESGCGNGWLSAKISGIKNAIVTGIDVNETELAQARSVFATQENLTYSFGDIRDQSFTDKRYDIILFAASVQYFPSLNDILQCAVSLLKPGGEVHLLDTHFYTAAEVPAARERTRQYYHKMGFPEMSNFYFHHQLSALDGFNYTILFDPRRLINRLLHRKDRFYWVRIRKV